MLLHTVIFLSCMILGIYSYSIYYASIYKTNNDILIYNQIKKKYICLKDRKPCGRITVELIN